MPAIVDQKLFDEVQAKMSENTKSRTSKAAEYILSGKLICGQCQSSMVGDSVRKGNKIYRYYACGNRKRGEGCKTTSIPKDILEQLVFDDISYNILTDDSIERLADLVIDGIYKHNNDHTALEAAKKQFADIDKRKKNLIESLAQGIISQEIIEEVNSLEVQSMFAKDSIAEMERKKPEFKKEDLMVFFTSLKKEDTDNREQGRRKMLKTFINSIYVKTAEDGGLELVYELIVGDKTKRTTNMRDEEFAGSDDFRVVSHGGFEPPTE